MTGVVASSYLRKIRMLLAPSADLLEVLDIPLGLQDLDDFKLQLGGRDVDLFVLCHTGIPDLGQHIRDGI
jgi:hypothetical protein